VKKLKFFLIISFLFCYPLLQGEEGNNKIIVCDNGLEMFQWDLDFLSHAQESVEVIACFFGGKTACDLIEAIKARLQQVPTLQVHLLASPILMKEKEWSMIHELQERYPDNFHLELSTQVASLSPDLLTIDNHVKVFIVDETYFSAGGTNLEEKHCSEGTYTPDRETGEEQTEVDELLPAGMRDQDIVGKGPLARELRKAFFQLYSVWENYNQTQLLEKDLKIFENKHYFEVTNNCFVERFETATEAREVSPQQIKCVIGGPHQPVNAITQEYIRLIGNAKQEIILAHLYFLPVYPIFQALMEAANRGVKLTIVTNGISEFSPISIHFFGWGNRLSYLPMFYGNTYHFWDATYVASLPVKNTHIYEYSLPDMLLHKKMMLIDGKIFVVGSYNMSLKSACGDYELIIVLDSEEIAHDAMKVHQTDLKHSIKVLPQQAFDWYFDPVTSYLGELQKKFSGIL
jgi:phosphatidylserine/phosphatidylglycerophosphate/cardiolipin synthase-like enzyme